MKKLALELEELAVESFPTTAEDEPERGTVEGAMATRDSCRTSCAGGPFCTCPV